MWTEGGDGVGVGVSGQLGRSQGEWVETNHRADPQGAEIRVRGTLGLSTP